ncbi:hypothetical protein M9H77_06493 [Catharanthus roseus]|uniref:Uncharacterized protein n=1 Tax=Catharanthus roseus TaxID=4058 RepID=A0ACC0BSG7_CATRO|nr:hypothetical protein M9H77_06493 [Catharanthus roseus]
MPLLEAVGITPTGKNYTVATAFMCNEQTTAYKWTTNRAESKHSMLKLCLSTCHSDLETVFLNINSLIQGQIAKIKYTLKISKIKEKYGAKSNVILKNLSNKISHLALKKIMDELKKAREMVEEPGSNCLHYLRKMWLVMVIMDLELYLIFCSGMKIIQLKFLQLRDGYPLPPLQVQWEYHRDVRVSGWVVPYRDRILDWVARYREMYPPQSHSHVIIN